MKRSSLWLLALTCSAWALPEGPNVVHGNLQVVQPQGHILQILQSSPQAIINWNAFNIQADQWVQFLQGNSQSVALNRVVGGDPSQILGQLSANGRVFLVNPNGILFGPQSTVNAGSFVASTLQISDSDFLAGRYDFRQSPGHALASIVNQGSLEVGDNGWLVLLSPLIDNQGLIVAQQGQVVLGASQQATLTLDPGGLLQLALPDNPTGPAGPVLLSAGQASSTLSQVISASSLVEAGSIVQTENGIVLQGSEGVLLHQGQIDTQHLQMNSSQATVLAPQSRIDSEAGFVEVLSQGTTWSGGSIRNTDGFVEISGANLGVYAPVDVGALGTLLLDPGILRVTNNPGTDPTNPFQAIGSDHSVNAAVLGSQTGTVTLQADDDIIVESGVVVNFLNTVDVLFEAGRDILMETGSALIASDASSTIEFRSGFQSNAPFGPGGRVQLQDVLFNDVSVIATGNEETQLFGDIGRAGSPTTLAVQTPNITLKTGSQVNVLGSDATVLLEATVANLIVESGAQLNAPTGSLTLAAPGDVSISGSVNSAGTVNILGDEFILLPGASIQSTQGLLNLSSADILLLGGELNFPTINTAGADNITILGTINLGVNGASNSFVLNADQVVSLGAGSRLQIRGTDASLSMGVNDRIELGANAQIDFSGTPGSLTMIAPIIDLQNGSILMPETSSMVILNGTQIALGDIDVATSLQVVSALGSTIEVAGAVSAAEVDFVIPGGGRVVGTQAGAEIFAQDSLQITGTDHIYGSGPQQSLTLRSGPTANIFLDILGENFLDSGPPGEVPTPVGVAGSILYLPPQSPNLTVNSPNGQVRVLTESPPPPPPGPQPAPPELDPTTIESRQDLTSVQQAVLTQQLAQSQPQLANLPPATLSTTGGLADGLSTTHPGLTSFYAANPSSLLVETVVLSPEEVSQNSEVEQERVANVTQILLANQGEDDEDVRFWRALMERVLIWEDED